MLFASWGLVLLAVAELDVPVLHDADVGLWASLIASILTKRPDVSRAWTRLRFKENRGPYPCVCRLDTVEAHDDT